MDRIRRLGLILVIGAMGSAVSAQGFWGSGVEETIEREVPLDSGGELTVENVNGKPAYVRVIGNDPGSRFNPGEVIADEGTIREL